MNYHTVSINTAAPKHPDTSILVIYTGGTLGMVYDNTGKHLIPFDFTQVLDKIPELIRFEFNLTVIELDELVDSSNIKPSHWITLARLIKDNYVKYDGFVILHGTDTMAYSASALSYMLEGLNKPVIFTGAQLPIGAPRTDARSNFISALEIASAKMHGRPLVPEVCIYFSHRLLRGNRSRKVESAEFAAFETENYPLLAEAGIKINYNFYAIQPYNIARTLRAYEFLDTNVTILKLFPGISPATVRSILGTEGLKAAVVETYGSGNAPSEGWFIDCLKEAIDRDVILLNVSQCTGGTVSQGRYETSKQLAQIGMISGRDITTEAAVTKLMFLLANCKSLAEVKVNLQKSLRGEIT